MSNPTELPDLDACPFCGEDMTVESPSGMATGPGLLYVICDCGAMGAGGKTMSEAIAKWNRRAQPEGEAPQAANRALIEEAAQVFESGAAHNRKAGRTVFAHSQQDRADRLRAALTAPAAQHAESGARSHETIVREGSNLVCTACGTSAPGTPEAPKPPFPISDDEMAALRRFWECATDGEGYDVEKPMMQRLAEMGLVQRKSGAYYMATEFGLYVLGEYTMERAAQLDGGQEGSESNG